MTPDEFKQKIAKARRSEQLAILVEGLEGIAPLATSLMWFKKERWADWLGLGLAIGNAIMVGRSAYQRMKAEEENPLYAIDASGKQVMQHFPGGIAKPLVKILQRYSPVDLELHDETTYSMCEIEGEVFVYGSFHGEDPIVYYIGDRREQSLKALRKAVWDNFPSNHLQMSKEGLMESQMEGLGDVVITQMMRDTRGYMQEFLDQGVMRSYLLEGPPGTGKSTLIRHLLHEGEFRSLRLEASTISHSRFVEEGTDVGSSIRWLIELTQPDVVVIDDIDLLPSSANQPLLSTIEWCRSRIKIFLASANNRQRMTPALLRAGRFDDFIEIHEIEEEVLRKILGPDFEDIEEFKEWPIAYVLDLKVQVDVLGIDRAKEKIPEMSHRLQEVNRRILEEFRSAKQGDDGLEDEGPF